MTKQVDKDHYSFDSYSQPARWVSSYHQLASVLAFKPARVLEVGVGDKVFGSYLRNNTDVEYTSVDIAEDLSPDIVASILSIPVADEAFDVACAFEVLEHIPFEDFEPALQELSRIAKKSVVLSLPHFGPPLFFSCKIPFFSEIRIHFKIPFYKKHEFNGEHYWEIGKRGYSHKKIKGILEKYFVVRKDFIPFENQYHHFYILEKKK